MVGRGPAAMVARGLFALLLVRSTSAPTCGEGTTLVPEEDACTASCPEQATASGRVYIAGIFDMQDDGGYTEQLKHHFQLAVALLNNHSDEMWDDVLSDAVIEHTMADAGCSENLGARAYWSIREWGRPLHGVIGCRCSSASKAVQRIAQLERVPQIAMASTSAELSDRQLYPYFYRTVAPEGMGGSLGALKNLFRAFGWTRIGVLFTETVWASTTAQQFISDWTGEHLAQDGRGAWTGEIAYSNPIAMDADGLNMQSVRQAFADIPVGNPAVNSKVILLLCDTEHSWPIFQYAAESGFQKDTVFVGSRTWPGDRVPAGALSAFNVSAAPGFIGIQNFENTDSPLYQSYIQRLNQYEVAQGRPISERLSFYGAETVDATVALATAMSSLPQSQRRNGTAVDAAILSLNFSGVSGNVQFDEQGDRRDPRFSVWNLGPWNSATESFEWRKVGSVGPSASQTDLDSSSICWAGLGCGAVPPSDKYQPRLGCSSGADCVNSAEGPLCDTTVGKCVAKVERADLCASRSEEGHLALFEPIQVACQKTTWDFTGAVESYEYTSPYICNAVNDTDTVITGPKHEVATKCAQFLPEVLGNPLGSSNVQMCCSAEDDGLARWVNARWRQFDIEFGQCENCRSMARKLLCQAACDLGNHRFHTGGDGVARQARTVAAVSRTQQDICPSLCKDVHLACSSVVWSDSVRHLYKESVDFCAEVLDLRVTTADESWREVGTSDKHRICTPTSAMEAVHCVGAGSHRATGAVATLLCTFTIFSAFLSGKIRINFIPPASILLCTGALLGMIVKEFIVPIEQRIAGTHTIIDMVQFDTYIFSFTLLPVIIFSSSFNMEHHALIFFRLYITQITFFAVVGTMLAITFTGVSIAAINGALGPMLAYELSIAEAMMFGSLISAVDPVATLAAFASVGVDPRVYSMIYGESILNDAVAIVFFAVFKQISESGAGNDVVGAGNLVAVTVQLVWMSLGSVLCGVMWGVLVSFLFKFHGAKPPAPDKPDTASASAAKAAANERLAGKTPFATNPNADQPRSDAAEFHNPVGPHPDGKEQADASDPQQTAAEKGHKKHKDMADAAIFFLASMASYYVAEALHVSGIISALFCGIVCNQIAVRNMTFEAREYARSLYTVLAEICDHLLMVWVGLLYYLSLDNFTLAFSLVALVLVIMSRALSVFFCGGVTRCFGVQMKMETQLMMFAAGLRGAVALALVMQMPTSSAEQFSSTTLFIIFWTNVVLGGLTTPLVSHLKIPNETDKTLDVSEFEFTADEIEFLMQIDTLQNTMARYLLVHGTDNPEIGFDDAKHRGRQANRWQKRLNRVMGYRGATGAVTFMDGRLEKQGSGPLSSLAWSSREFEVGKDQLRYRAGKSKDYKWLLVDLSGGTIKLDSEKPDEFMLVDNDGREWQLRAKSEKEAFDWVRTIATNTGAKDLSPQTDSMRDLTKMIEEATDVVEADTDTSQADT